MPHGEKLVLRCSINGETTWYKDNKIFYASSPRVRLIKQSLKFKYIEPEDASSYACLVESNGTLEWRNVTIRIEPLQNDGYQHDVDKLGTAMGAHRAEEETNELEIGARS